MRLRALGPGDCAQRVRGRCPHSLQDGPSGAAHSLRHPDRRGRPEGFLGSRRASVSVGGGRGGHGTCPDRQDASRCGASAAPRGPRPQRQGARCGGDCRRWHHADLRGGEEELLAVAHPVAPRVPDTARARPLSPSTVDCICWLRWRDWRAVGATTASSSSWPCSRRP